MKYEQYTPEEIEDLARECERLAERVAELLEASDQLLDLSERLLSIIRAVIPAGQAHDDELHRYNQATLENVAGKLRDLRHIVGSPRKEPLETQLPF